MSGWHRKTRIGAGTGGMMAFAAALLLGAGSEVGAQAIFTCDFNETEVDLTDLRDAIAADIGGNVNRNSISIPIIIVPTFNDNLGQPDAQGANAELTQIVICINTDEVASTTTGVSESDDFPSTGTADLLEVQQTSYVLIDRGGPGRQLRICHADESNECIVASE